MAIKFDTLLDEQTYSECMEELYDYAPRIAREIGDNFIKADVATDINLAHTCLDKVIDYSAGVLAGAEYSNNTELVALMRRLMLTLVWSNVSV